MASISKTTHSPILLAAVTSATIVCLFAFYSLFRTYRLYLRVESQESLRQSQKEQNEKEYLNLLNQTKSPQDSPSQSVQTPSHRVATGSHRVNFIFAKPEQVSDSQIQPLINNLTSSLNLPENCDHGCSQNLSLNYIPIFLDRQSEIYNPIDLSLTTIFTPITTLYDLNKVGDIAYLWSKDPFGTIKLQDKFEQLITSNNLDPNDLNIFLYFDNSFNKNADAREDSFYEYKSFRSFARPEKGRAYINIYDFSPEFSSQTTLIVTHELLHLFGASDKYNENISNNQICSSKGLGDPDKVPLYPQDQGDIMCLFVQKGPTNFTRGSLTNNSLIINPITAKEIGWK